MVPDSVLVGCGFECTSSSLAKKSGIDSEICDPMTTLIFSPKSLEFVLLETKPEFDKIFPTIYFDKGKMRKWLLELVIISFYFG